MGRVCACGSGGRARFPRAQPALPPHTHRAQAEPAFLEAAAAHFSIAAVPEAELDEVYQSGGRLGAVPGGVQASAASAWNPERPASLPAAPFCLRLLPPPLLMTTTASPGPVAVDIDVLRLTLKGEAAAAAAAGAKVLAKAAEQAGAPAPGAAAEQQNGAAQQNGAVHQNGAAPAPEGSGSGSEEDGGGGGGPAAATRHGEGGGAGGGVKGRAASA